MTIEGAIVDLKKLIDDDSIPFWEKPGIQKIMETVEAEREEHLWIPVTERLPEEDGDYLVTTSSFYGATIYVTTRNFSDGEWTYDRAVTAWMPLPTPYEGSEAK